jgi:hypothetical protein
LYHYRAGYFLETHLLDSHIQFPPVTVWQVLHLSTYSHY